MNLLDWYGGVEQSVAAGTFWTELAWLVGAMVVLFIVPAWLYWRGEQK